jgi:protein TonB
MLGGEAIEEYDFPPPMPVTMDHEKTIEQISVGWAPPLPQISFEPAVGVTPEIVQQVRPVYPEMARELRLSGTVLVDVLVSSDGHVLDMVLNQSAHPLLDEAALRAARDSVFRPARQGQQPVSVWVTLPYRFAVDE